MGTTSARPPASSPAPALAVARSILASGIAMSLVRTTTIAEVTVRTT
jgi:hypothetical protein